MPHAVIIGRGKTGESVNQFLIKRGWTIRFYDDSSPQPFNIVLDRVDTLVVSPSTTICHPLYQEALKCDINIMSDFDFFFKYDLECIGITGTNGKSTTTALMGHVLKSIRGDVYIGGNIGIPVLDLQRDEKGLYVLEMSSYQLEHVKNAPLDGAILLNITPDHIDHHGTMACYVDAKTKIFNDAKHCFLCIDDDYTKKIYDDIKLSKNVVTFSTKTKADFWIKGCRVIFNNEPIFDLSTLFLKGEHNHQNVLAVIACLITLGFDQTLITKGLQSFKGLEHRQEIVLIQDDLIFINDSKGTNANATEKALRAYQDDDIYWILGGESKEGGIESLTPYLGSIRKAYLVGKAQDEFATFLSQYNVPFEKTKTIDVATQKAYRDGLKSNTTKKKIILLSPACASFDQFKNFEERGCFFKDVVQKIVH